MNPCGSILRSNVILFFGANDTSLQGKEKNRNNIASASSLAWPHQQLIRPCRVPTSEPTCKQQLPWYQPTCLIPIEPTETTD